MVRRRYKIADNRFYADRFDWLKSQSPILNHELNTLDSRKLQQGQSKQQLQSIIIELEGQPGKDGQFIGDDGYLTPSKLALKQAAIQAVEDEFTLIKQTAANTGRRIPEEMPKDLREKLWAAEAAVDITLEEIDKLKIRLEHAEDEETKESDRKVLKGRLGCGRLSNGITVDMDGQIVKPDKNKELRIADPRSPYNGMPLCDYVDFIAKPYNKARAKAMNDAIEWNSTQQNGPARDTKSEMGRVPLPPWPDCVPRPEIATAAK
jgi:hypothetical protein